MVGVPLRWSLMRALVSATGIIHSPSTVFTTAGGVKFIVLKEGTGPVARDGDFCVVDFTG